VILASVALGIAGTEPVVQTSLGSALPIVELVLGAFFLIELLLRTWATGVRPNMLACVARFGILHAHFRSSTSW